MRLAKRCAHWNRFADMRFDRWRHENSCSWRLSIWRMQIELNVYRHGGILPDRWVIAPALVYDRRTKAREEE